MLKHNMPRGQKMMRIPASGSMQKEFIDKMINSFCETKKIESARGDTVIKVFAETDQRIFTPGQSLPTGLDDLYSDVHSAFRVDHSFDTHITMLQPPSHVLKNFIYKLPDAPPNTIYRIVLLAGSHEIFYSTTISKFIGNRGIFVPQGYAMKLSAGHSDFTYDNKNVYNKEIYSGKGFKRPETRYLIIFDFISTKEDDNTKTLAIEAETVTVTVPEEIVTDSTKILE